MWKPTVLFLAVCLCCFASGSLSGGVKPMKPISQATSPSPTVISLDGPGWLIATDPTNVGREEKWFEKPQPGAKQTKVPWVIQDSFPNYHGLVWYWRDVSIPANPYEGGRYLLKFWAVDYQAEVWLNNVHVGSHEGGEAPFVLDVTKATKPGRSNRIAVRVLNPTWEPIDGIALMQTPHRNKTYPYSPGSDYNHGGIQDSVELMLVPAVRVEDVFVKPDPKTGIIRVEANIRNAGARAVKAHLRFAVSPAASGETIDVATMDRTLKPGDTKIEARVHVTNPRLWDLNDPCLYRVTASVAGSQSPAGEISEVSTRCGFRTFEFRDGYFRLNGRRVFLKSSHSGADVPVGIHVPINPDYLRKDLIYDKTMGFNMIRFIAGVPRRYQLDLADEIGLMVYEECYASWCLTQSPEMVKRFDSATFDMIRRDRNHPSIVIWALLNETGQGELFQHAASLLPDLQKLDGTRMIVLNGGRFDNQTKDDTTNGLQAWAERVDAVPNVTFNPSKENAGVADSIWAPGQLALHPGVGLEPSAARWVAPKADQYAVSAKFTGIAAKPTRTIATVFHNGKPIYEGAINSNGGGPSCEFAKTISAKKGDKLDVVVSSATKDPNSDTTAVELTISGTDGKTYDITKGFSTDRNPNGPWSFGWLKPGDKLDLSTFTVYTKAQTGLRNAIGGLANAGSLEWENVISDQHHYPPVPHDWGIINFLRNLNGGNQHVFLSEYGIGSAIDLNRLARHYEQLNATYADDAQVYRRFLDMFLVDWDRWKLQDTFADPSVYFRECLSKMGGQRLLGINAIRANPNIVGYSATGCHDQGLTAEGFFTTFRELKPGTTDAVFDGFYPLRWCTFVEPLNVYRGTNVHFEAVLSNEDVLKPGEYPVRVQVVGPVGNMVVDKSITVTVPDTEGPFAIPAYNEDMVVDGPSGKYRLLVTFEKGGAATGGEAGFFVADPAEMPSVAKEVTLWGDDQDLAEWLSDNKIQTHRFDPAGTAAIGTILVGNTAGADWGQLTEKINQGATAIFLCPEVFASGNDSTAHLPLANRGRYGWLKSDLYIRDEFAKFHPIFDGLPTGCILDLAYYRDVIPAKGFIGLDAPDEAVSGGIKTSLGYESGLFIAVYKVGKGQIILNSFKIRDQLGKHPAAERLLRNMLRYSH